MFFKAFYSAFTHKRSKMSLYVNFKRLFYSAFLNERCKRPYCFCVLLCYFLNKLNMQNPHSSNWSPPKSLPLHQTLLLLCIFFTNIKAYSFTIQSPPQHPFYLFTFSFLLKSKLNWYSGSLPCCEKWVCV